jgi:predicted nucleic acid-binding protein
MSDALIVNASPLIFLGNDGRLELLRCVGAGKIIVPEVVFSEVASAVHDPASRALVAADWIERIQAPPIPVGVAEWDLGPGESAVIATALSMRAPRVVLDDLSARKCALAFRLDLMGTLGIVIAAHRRGVIDDPRQVLLGLRARGMWLSDAVIDEALRLASTKA